MNELHSRKLLLRWRLSAVSRTITCVRPLKTFEY